MLNNEKHPIAIININFKNNMGEIIFDNKELINQIRLIDTNKNIGLKNFRYENVDFEKYDIEHKNTFDLTNIFGDLMNCLDVNNEFNNGDGYGFYLKFNQNIYNHVLFNNPLVHYHLKINEIIDNYSRTNPKNLLYIFKGLGYTIDLNAFLIDAEYILKLINDEMKFTLTDYELAKAFSDISYEFEVINIQKDGSYESHHGTYFGMNFDILEQIEEMKSEFDEEYNTLFSYKCYTYYDFLNALLHYHLMFNLKYSTCNHCQKIFATETFKIKYCNRKSPLEKYNHLSCYEASKSAKRFISRRRDHTNSYIQNFHPSIETYDNENYLDYDNEYNSIKEKYNSNIAHYKYIEEMSEFLRAENIKKKYYKKS